MELVFIDDEGRSPKPPSVTLETQSRGSHELTFIEDESCEELPRQLPGQTYSSVASEMHLQIFVHAEQERHSDESMARISKLLFFSAHGNLAGVRKILHEDEMYRSRSPHRASFTPLWHLSDYDERTAMHIAAATGQIAILDFLIKKGAPLDPVDRWHRTPLQDAMQAGHHEVVQLLISAGAKGEDALSTTPSHILGLSDRRRWTTVDPPPSHDAAQPAPESNEGGTEGSTLWTAAANNKAEEVTAMIAAGVDPNASNYDNRTALHIAACEGALDVVRCLIKAHAAVNPLDRWKRTPLQEAVRSDGPDSALVEVLESAGGKAFEGGQLVELNKSHALTSCLKGDSGEISLETIDQTNKTQLGRGSFGIVYLCTWQGTRVACKFLSPTKNKEAWDEFRLEATLMRSLKHPNIVQFFGADLTQEPGVLVTEYMAGGSLTDVLRRKHSKGKQVGERAALAIASDIAAGMCYLHSQKPPIIHRDLKPANLLIDKGGIVKVADFGLAKVSRGEHNTHYIMTGETGSYRYMAPEVFRHQSYSEKVDVYSFGVILYEMLEGKSFLAGRAPVDVAWAVEKGQRPTFVRKQYRSGVRALVEECWDADPSNRPAFPDICQALQSIQGKLKPERCTIM